MKKIFFMLTALALFGSAAVQAQNAKNSNTKPKSERVRDQKQEKPGATTAAVAADATPVRKSSTKSDNVVRPAKPHVAVQR